MSAQSRWIEFEELIGAQCEGELTVGQAARLEELLTGDVNLRRDYILQLQIHAWAERRAEVIQDDAAAADDGVQAPWADESVDSLVHLDSTDGGGSESQRVSSGVSDLPSPLSPILSSSLPSPFAALISSGWPVAYLVAALVFGVGLLIGAIVHVSQPSQIVHQPSTDANRSFDAKVQENRVGRITGMIDCVWEGSGFRIQGAGAANLPSPSGGHHEVVGTGGEGGRESDSPLSTLHSPLVCLGDRIALKSGLLEITYDTGAKVILQGPVTYEVESPAGGYLAVGKLTARLDSHSEVSSLKSQISNQKSEIRNQKSPDLCPLTSDLFVIRTPTALVTDLGTEFGVEVKESGSTGTHVFRGVVEVQPAALGDRRGKATRLAENESAIVNRPQNGSEPSVLRQTIDATAFVRPTQLRQLAEAQSIKPLHRWQAYSRKLRKDPALVAYYTFESTGLDNATLPNLSTTHRALDGHIEGAEWVQGRWPGKLALYFHGQGSGDRVVLPEHGRPTYAQAFSIAVWFRVTEFGQHFVPSLIAKGGDTWRIQRYGQTRCLTIASTASDDRESSLTPHTEVTDHRWHFLVAVIEPHAHGHRKSLYLDGRMESEVDVPRPLAQTDEPVWLGANSAYAEREFHGMVDELAIFARQLSPHEIASMFEAGDPAITSSRAIGRSQ
jgi:hypothetical protein